MLYGGQGNDILFGNIGNDLFYGGSGIDIYYGGAGADTFVTDGTDQIVDFNAAEGDVIIASSTLNLAGQNGMSANEYERKIAGQDNDLAVDLTGLAKPDDVSGWII